MKGMGQGIEVRQHGRATWGGGHRWSGMNIRFKSRRGRSQGPGVPGAIAFQALIARLNSLGLILKASGAIGMVGSEVHSGRSPLAAESGPQEGLEEEPCMSRHRTWGDILEVPPVWLSQDTYEKLIMSRVISVATEVGRSGVGGHDFS